ncbi:uncharacterized protein TRIADDRAFT_52727 [Trichoplax adhaerens]|uniref:Uncharacterized protein n=1 Tax=Trichoplax adhaerens TaxID=10228 RepID=B3RJZ2_TRIAD|nr:hypothetical protein TRIADDRAFT_52727 [Trichoplax adhaerens]EDV29868.1 hypothetical protein TRIADDRAFT_52727 [Trichoplax adhaerens]|eukprot:XP_002109070.1 hypothetical protein TRIADDRAFT_52727 [Trichoplax adhaerens]
MSNLALRESAAATWIASRLALFYSISKEKKLSRPSRIEMKMNEKKQLQSCCSQWYSLTTKWQEKNNQSFTIANQVVNLKLQLIRDRPASHVATEVTNMKISVQDNHQMLVEALNELGDIYRNFERLTSNFQAIRDLYVQKQQENVIICKTWTTNHFCMATYMS